MPERYALTAQARAELREIIRYIAEDNPAAARKVKAKMLEAFRRLGEYPHLGQRREDITDKPVRFWPIYSYAIIYSPDTSPIHILHIMSSYRDLKGLL